MVILPSLIVGWKMLNESKEFFIDVVSNASMEIFPENTLSKFVNKLPQTIHLDGDWVVGVHEIFYPITYDRPKLTVKFCLIYGIKERQIKMAGKKLSITFYEDTEVSSIFEKFNNEFDKLVKSDQVHPNPDVNISAPKISLKNGKVDVQKGESTYGPIMPMFLDREFVRRLGFTFDDYKNKYMDVLDGNYLLCTANSVPTLGTRSHLLFIYTDIIHDHFVGDGKSRLLKVVPLTKGIYDNIGYMSITKPFYYPVRIRDLTCISILLADENGQEIKFTDGRTHLSLHFKKKELV